MKYGKRPARFDSNLFQFAEVKTKPDLPKATPGFGHSSLITDWGMLANDNYGVCAEAGSDHETMLFNAIAGKNIEFTDSCVLSDYSAVAGFDPNDPENTDKGTDMLDLMKYRRKTGMVDAKDQHHAIGAYVGLTAGNFDELLEALYTFDAVGIGVEMPNYAMDQFNAGVPWDYLADKDNNIEGGHYICVVGYPEQDVLDVVTWGKIQKMTRAFYENFNDESYGILSEESLVNGKSAEGLDIAALQAAISVL